MEEQESKVTHASAGSAFSYGVLFVLSLAMASEPAPRIVITAGVVEDHGKERRMNRAFVVKDLA